ncbi:MAG: VOC family protein [Candidatus Saccharimonadales bacterium]|jgi:predicted 3-demethylubiquinone-9 3-methyltransferase (glyoxalase superfamily)
MSKIITFLWFDNQAEEAANFYTSIFNNSKITGISHYDKSAAEAANRSVGSVLTVSFNLAGQNYMALNGGPLFKFTEAISFMVSCEDQAEIDYYWGKLSADPEAEQCGWLKDKFGLSWQIVPKNMSELIKTDTAMKAMLNMKKIIIADLIAAR